MWELDYKESWAPKNWCFGTVVLEKTLESPLDYKEIQPVHPKGDHPGYLLEGLMLKLKLQYFGHLMQRADSFENTLMLGKIEGRSRRRRGQQRLRLLDGITNSMDMSLSKLQDIVKDREPWRAIVCGVAKNQTQLSNWTTTIAMVLKYTQINLLVPEITVNVKFCTMLILKDKDNEYIGILLLSKAVLHSLVWGKEWGTPRV